MSEEQSDLPGPLNVDADKLEVTYIRRGPNHPSHPSQAAQTVLRPWLSYPGPMTRLPLGRLSGLSKSSPGYGCVFGRVRGSLAVYVVCFSSRSGCTVEYFTTSSRQAPRTRSPLTPRGPRLLQWPRPPRLPIWNRPARRALSIQSAIRRIFRTLSTIKVGLYFLPCVNAFRFNVDLMTQFKNRMEDGVWDRENPTKLPVGGEDAYKKYSIEYALALARDTNVTYEELNGYWGKEYNKVKYSIRKVNDPLPRVALDCDQAVYTDSSTDVDRARSSVQKGSFTTLTTECEGTLRDSGTQRKEPKRAWWSPKKKSSPKLDSSPMKVDSSPLDVDSSPAKYENYTPTGEYREAISPVVCVLKVML
ncbi:hypothetical protein PRIPAC_96330 [Pristionchus pacificus]|uniref:Uncharacterized protein n=2 Tax=Pristionchus pacificus TaxID=54126 RepID=A0A2A6B322_PRIPA|nr:hypothetical protein PRIPAC_96330 [Pristionchus pacificus]|eukprot:PDM60274.1 hypothetical protein PRIPAC_54099 [Pristionchus pacificus]